MRFAFVCLTLIALSASTGVSQERQLERAPSPVDNPLKGLVPYARPTPDRFPHSMEFSYLGLAELMTGPNEFDWQPLESLLDDIASRGNQAVIRVYLEYPGKENGIPKFLTENGLKVHTYLNTNTQPFPPTKVSTPDYHDKNLRAALTAFIEAWGNKYDGDPRIGFITAGLLGTWGEWHTYPRNDLWAPKETQREVLDAFEKWFVKTPILLRYPAGDDHYDKAPNADRKFGYHDDSLCWATLKTSKKEDDWFFIPALEAAGKNAINKWKQAPIGGEIRPEVWGKIFDKKIDIPQAQPFDACVKQLHLSWCMDTGMFREAPPKERLERALSSVQRMGYDFHVVSCDFAEVTDTLQLNLKIAVVNQGVAPFYYDWPIEVAFAKPDSSIAAQSIVPKWSLKGLLPQAKAHVLNSTVETDTLPAGTYSLLLRVKNPLENGKPLRFANRDQDTTVPGWLTLGPVKLTDGPKTKRPKELR